jgi:hypothetical protein
MESKLGGPTTFLFTKTARFTAHIKEKELTATALHRGYLCIPAFEEWLVVALLSTHTLPRIHGETSTHFRNILRKYQANPE